MTPTPSGRSFVFSTGFSLVELSIVLVIMSFLIGGLMLPVSAHIDLLRSRETRRYLSDAKEALLGFAVANCRLPCPAAPNAAIGDPKAGVEYAPTTTGCSTSAAGVLPWSSLGVAETDGWGRRLSYGVSEDFAKSATCSPSAQAFALSSDGKMTILATAAGGKITSGIPAVLVSHGNNGFRAYLPGGSRLAQSPDADEEENADADDAFVSKSPTPSFDDIVDWISPNVLKNRMISSGRLP